jgi:hypothetical protein
MYTILCCVLSISLGVHSSERETMQSLPSRDERGKHDVSLLRLCGATVSGKFTARCIPFQKEK